MRALPLLVALALTPVTAAHSMDSAACSLSLELTSELIEHVGSRMGLGTDTIKGIFFETSTYFPERHRELRASAASWAKLEVWLEQHPEFVEAVRDYYNERRPGSTTDKTLELLLKRMNLSVPEPHLYLLATAVNGLGETRGRMTTALVNSAFEDHLFDKFAENEEKWHQLHFDEMEMKLKESLDEVRDYRIKELKGKALPENLPPAPKVVRVPQFEGWLTQIKDPTLRTTVARLMERVGQSGSEALGASKLLTFPEYDMNVHEVRIDLGPGYRLYYRIDPENGAVVFLEGTVKPREGKIHSYEVPVTHARKAWHSYLASKS